MKHASRLWKFALSSAMSASMLLLGSQAVFATELTDAEVGRLLFFDTDLSFNRTMSCATCHDPTNAFTDQRKTIANGIVSRGADGKSFGVRNTPTISYTNASPTFHFDQQLQEFVGGQFWDGRSATHAQQALGPPLDKNEMAMPSAVELVKRLQNNPIYADAFKSVYGKDIFFIQTQYSKYRKLGDPREQPQAFTAMGNFISAFEKTDFFSPYDSKYDRYLAGEYTLSAIEDQGRRLFFEDPDVSCRNCHMMKSASATKEPFSNYRFRNVGVPRNPLLLALPGKSPDFRDNGMMDNTRSNTEAFQGKFKTPTLRNIAVTPPYMHNGVFRELRTVVEFFDHFNNPNRKLNPETGQPWSAPEIDKNIANVDLMGRALSDQEIDALVAFMMTLTDKRYEDIVIPSASK
ncbi:cytochrome-c peroxidase [Psychrobacter lutiphocae]|uniref:cytochrome-c peroxidase n=1 Tax=Psychrobacter lutiphocae TaxID=540500 RepID=UPI0003755098|nr:cytochrome c peroxidase [Psychrobacter lutiphocae]